MATFGAQGDLGAEDRRSQQAHPGLFEAESFCWCRRRADRAGRGRGRRPGCASGRALAECFYIECFYIECFYIVFFI